MYKVKYIADGMIIWHGNAVVGIKGLTLPEMFDECDCYKLPGNAFDYSLAPNQEFTKEQLDYINKSVAEWGEDEDEEEPVPDDNDRYYADEQKEDEFWDDDDLPF